MKKRLGVALALAMIAGAGIAYYWFQPSAGGASSVANLEQKMKWWDPAFSALFSACPRLGQQLDKVESFRAQLVGKTLPKPPEIQKHGWSEYIEMSLRLTDTSTLVPERYRDGRHTVRYYVGGGDNPGIVAQDNRARALCDMPMEGEEDFLPWPPMRGILQAIH